MKDATAYGTGRRKESVARVWIKPGNGAVVVNDKQIEEYFTRYKLVKQAKMPLNATQNEDKIDVEAHTRGGGIAGQADALRHGLAMALVDMDEENRTILGPEGLLTRDPRVKERKHAFCRGARRRKQFSKR